ncbi:MAG TPA: aminotransferase class V-fold PLP-dependent enzyme, partial [Acidimicrobiales bacterium]|nr:aminotransferase class V-fold PLP-dependent enzyme [Acidimicrobiales bacterium]
MSDLRSLLLRTADHAAAYRDATAETTVYPTVDRDAVRVAIGGRLPDGPSPAEDVVDQLIAGLEPAMVATTGPRYFGFVVGGALDAATAVDMLAVGWDQPAYNHLSSPASALVEEVAGRWLVEILGLPHDASFGFVTGAQGANTVCLAAARHKVLDDAGWDVERDGLHGGPGARVVASEERHATIDRTLRLLGFGTGAILPVATDGNGAIDIASLRDVLAGGPTVPTIVCLQAGNVNTGACDDLASAVAVAHEYGAWAHVDGAFGLWAAASPSTQHLVAGIETADSWATD